MSAPESRQQMKMRMERGALIRSGALALLVVFGLLASPAEASVSRDVSFKADPFAALPQLARPAFVEVAKAVERTNTECVALCELAASVDVDPFGYGSKPRPFEGKATPFGRQYQYAHDNPTFYVDPTGHAAGDVWDPRTYFGENRTGGAWRGFKAGYFDNAADIGDSVGAFGKGVGKAGEGLVVGAASLVFKAVELDIKLKTGTFQQKKEALQEGYSMVAGTVGGLADGGRLLAHGVGNPDDVLDAASELGISKTSEVIGGATFDTALLLSPMAKGAPAGVVVEDAAGTAVRSVQASGSQLSIGSRAAREILRPVFQRLGGLERAVQPGQRLTTLDKARRFFLQDTASYPGVSYGPTGSFLKTRLPQFQWEQHHAFLQRKWIRKGGPSQWYPGDRLAQEGLQRVTDAGWNLMPIPRRLNQALGRSPLGTTLFGGGVIGTGVYSLSTAFGLEPGNR